jgi:hypothetical protein
MTHARLAGIAVVVLLAGGSAAARAQEDTVRVRPAPAAGDSAGQRPDTLAAPRRQRGDSVRPTPPISPGGAFLRSLLLPGWGQAVLGRHLTGALFVTFEGAAVAMVWKSEWQLRFAVEREKYVKSHRQEREDWITLLVFNHLFAAAEAYVAANLWDFPKGLHVRVVPAPPGVGFGVSVPLR